MKFFNLCIVLFCFLSFHLCAQNCGNSILKNDYRLIPSEGGKLIGFKRISDGKIGFVQNSSELNVMIEPMFDDMYNEDFNKSQRILVMKDGKWGAIDATFNTLMKEQPIIPCIYDSMTPFKNGRSWVIKGGNKFQIDLQGNKID